MRMSADFIGHHIPRLRERLYDSGCGSKSQNVRDLEAIVFPLVIVHALDAICIDSTRYQNLVAIPVYPRDSGAFPNCYSASRCARGVLLIPVGI